MPVGLPLVNVADDCFLISALNILHRTGLIQGLFQRKKYGPVSHTICRIFIEKDEDKQDRLLGRLRDLLSEGSIDFTEGQHDAGEVLHTIVEAIKVENPKVTTLKYSSL